MKILKMYISREAFRGYSIISSLSRLKSPLIFAGCDRAAKLVCIAGYRVPAKLHERMCPLRLPCARGRRIALGFRWIFLSGWNVEFRPLSSKSVAGIPTLMSKSRQATAICSFKPGADFEWWFLMCCMKALLWNKTFFVLSRCVKSPLWRERHLLSTHRA